MAALNLIVMVVCGLWFLVYLDRHTNRARTSGIGSPCLLKRLSPIIHINKAEVRFRCPSRQAALNVASPHVGMPPKRGTQFSDV
jgi:hypothetical protein